MFLRINILLITFLFNFAFIKNVNAEIKLNSFLSQSEVGVGDEVILTIELTADGESLPSSEPSVPTIDKVTFLDKRTSSSTRSQMTHTSSGIKLNTVRSVLYEYTFRAVEEGNAKIDAIEIEVNGKHIKTKPIVLKILPEGSVSQQASKPRRPNPFGNNPLGGFDDEENDPIDSIQKEMEQFQNLLNRRFGGTLGGGRPTMTAPKDDSSAFHILVEVDKKEAFEGEQIMVSWYLYTQGRVREIDTLKYPELKGFWKEDIQIATTLNFQQDSLNGVPYNKALLTSYALFPIEAGQTKIDSYRARATIMGDAWGFGRNFTATKASEEIPIVIKPLPTANRPENFSGAVGEFQMKVELSDKTVVANQPFALKVRFDGRGNAKLIELPKLNLPSGLEVYDIKKNSEYFKTGSSYKEFEVLLIARQSGDVEIPGVGTSYFDPQKEQYEKLFSEAIKITVLPGGAADVLAASRLSGDKKTESIFAPQMRINLSSKSGQINFTPFILSLFPIVLIGLVFLQRKKLFYVIKKDIAEDLKKRFQLIKKHAAQGKWRDAGVLSVNSIYYVLGELSGLGGANREFTVLLKSSPPSLQREMGDVLKKNMDEFSFIGFGPDIATKSIDEKVWMKKITELEQSLQKSIQLTQ